MIENAMPIGANETEPETKPELDDAWFEAADAFVGDQLVRHGRRLSANNKQSVSIRIDPEVIAWFKRDGAGWQTRINEALRRAAGL
jgi:uncharacterized protein (DUF4415 family)